MIVKSLNIISIILIVMGLVACQSNETITFSDENLENAIRIEVKKQDGHLQIKDFQGVRELDLANKDIQELEGINLLDGVELLFLQNNKIEDFSLLKEMDGLKEVNVSGNPIDDDDNQLKLVEELRAQGITVIVDNQQTGLHDGPGGFLWKVENGDTVVYLQGTIHVGTENLFPMHEKIEKAYEEADVVVPEIDITKIDLFQMQRTMMELGVYQDGSTIKDHISKDLSNKLEAFFSGYGVPFELVEGYKPWLLASTIESLLQEQLGFIEGVDEYFLTRASEDGKEIIALETAEEQFEIFAETSPQYQMDMLESSLMSEDEYNESLQQLLSVYMEGNVEKLLGQLSGSDEEISKDEALFLKRMNDDRNYKMAEKIIGFLEAKEKKTYFVIVGTMHYIWEPHIISILEKEGYQVYHIH